MVVEIKERDRSCPSHSTARYRCPQCEPRPEYRRAPVGDFKCLWLFVHSFSRAFHVDIRRSMVLKLTCKVDLSTCFHFWFLSISNAGMSQGLPSPPESANYSHKAYHSALNEESDVRQVGNIAVLPVKTKIRGPAPVGTRALLHRKSHNLFTQYIQRTPTLRISSTKLSTSSARTLSSVTSRLRVLPIASSSSSSCSCQTASPRSVHSALRRRNLRPPKP